MKLHLTMMVKNEESLLPQCLKSVKGLWDTAGIVDTGSTDKTIDICKKAGATVYNHPWTGDFSLHRNQSISYAGKADWLFIIDADEELVGDIKKLRAYLSKLPQEIAAVSIPLRDVHGDEVKLGFNSARLFRRGCIHYRYARHNTPYVQGGTAIYDGVYLKHYGYDLSKERMEQKNKDTLKGLEQRLAVDPDDYAAYFYLAQCYGATDIERSLKYSETYINNRSKVIGFNPSIFFTAAQAAFGVGDMEKVHKFCMMGLNESPNDIDLNWMRCQFGAKVNSPDDVYGGAVAYVRAYQEYQQDKSTQGIRFVFKADQAAYAFCLFHLIDISFQQGASALAELKTIKGTSVLRKKLKLSKLKGIL